MCPVRTARQPLQHRALSALLWSHASMFASRCRARLRRRRRTPRHENFAHHDVPDGTARQTHSDGRPFHQTAKRAGRLVNWSTGTLRMCEHSYSLTCVVLNVPRFLFALRRMRHQSKFRLWFETRSTRDKFKRFGCVRGACHTQANRAPEICDHTIFSCDHKCRFFADLPALRQKNR